MFAVVSYSDFGDRAPNMSAWLHRGRGAEMALEKAGNRNGDKRVSETGIKRVSEMGIKRVSEMGIKVYLKRGKFWCKKRGKYLPFRIHFLSPLVGARTGKR